MIAYTDKTHVDLKLAHCTTSTCTAASLTTVDTTTGYPDDGMSVAIGVDGYAFIAYGASTSSDLRGAHCSSFVCTPYQRG